MAKDPFPSSKNYVPSWPRRSDVPSDYHDYSSVSSYRGRSIYDDRRSDWRSIAVIAIIIANGCLVLWLASTFSLLFTILLLALVITAVLLLLVAFGSTAVLLVAKARRGWVEARGQTYRNDVLSNVDGTLVVRNAYRYEVRAPMIVTKNYHAQGPSDRPDGTRGEEASANDRLSHLLRSDNRRSEDEEEEGDTLTWK
jgi:hypothetical protein